MTQAGELEVQPAMFEHAVRVYDAMALEAKLDDDFDQLVYEGHLTQLFKKLLLSTPYYTSIKNKLAAMGCIEQIRRGGGSGTSRWVLWRAPDLETWKAADARKPRVGNKFLAQEQRIKDLIKMCSDHEARITQLEALLEGR